MLEFELCIVNHVGAFDYNWKITTNMYITALDTLLSQLLILASLCVFILPLYILALDN